MEYLESPYVIEVVVALLLGLALIPLWRRARRIDRPQANAWRRFLVYVGWFVAFLSLLTWWLLLWIVCEAWIDSVNPALPKKPSLIFLIFGSMLYFFLISLSGSAFEASSGDARSEIMRRIGRRGD